MTVQSRVSHLSDPRQVALAINGALLRTDPFGFVDSTQATMTVDRPMNIAGNVAVTGNSSSTGDMSAVNFNASGVYEIASIQVVGPRQTGWVADTGTAKKTANATYAAGTSLTYSATYTQSELTATGTRIAAIETALQNLSQEVKALKDALMTTGLIGT